jgi:hypothetical protein
MIFDYFVPDETAIWSQVCNKHWEKTDNPSNAIDSEDELEQKECGVKGCSNKAKYIIDHVDPHKIEGAWMEF